MAMIMAQINVDTDLFIALPSHPHKDNKNKLRAPTNKTKLLKHGTCTSWIYKNRLSLSG